MATTSIITMPEILFRSTFFELERAFLDGPIMELVKLNSDKVFETLMDDEILYEIEPEFRWVVLLPFFRVFASLSKHDNEEGEKFQKYLVELESFYNKDYTVRSWLIDQIEIYNYAGLKNIVDEAYKSGIMNPNIFGSSPTGDGEAPLPTSYDKETYFTILDKDWNTNFTTTPKDIDLDVVEAKIKSKIEHKLENQNSLGIDDDFNIFRDFDDIGFDDEGDLYGNTDLLKEPREADIIPITFKRDNDKIGRNAPCPCGSGKKYKKCCLNK